MKQIQKKPCQIKHSSLSIKLRIMLLYRFDNIKFLDSLKIVILHFNKNIEKTKSRFEFVFSNDVFKNSYILKLLYSIKF